MPLGIDEEALAAHVPPGRRKERGVFFTPAAVVEKVLEHCATVVPRGGPAFVVDPACGAGAFLSAAGQRWPGARLLGLELDGESARLCQKRVPSAQVAVGDALVGTALARLLGEVPPSAFVLWVGNPPYNGTSPLLRRKDAWQTACAWLPDGLELPRGTSLREDYVFFLLRASQWLEGRPGALAFVTGATLLDAFMYAPVRQALLSRLALEVAEDLGPGVFANARVRTCVTVWRSPARRTSSRFLAPSAEPVAVAPSAPEWALRPADREAEALDRAWRANGEPLTTLVPVSLPGLKTRFDELLVDDDVERLWARVRQFAALRSARQLEGFAREHAIPPRLGPKLEALFEASRGLKVQRSRLRRFFRYRGPLTMGPPAWCYLERRLIPRGDHRLQGEWDPHHGDARLVFNVRELPLTAHLLRGEGCVTAYRHSRFAPLTVPAEVLAQGPRAGRRGALGPSVPNLSARGAALASEAGGPAAVFAAIADFVRSSEVQEVWAPAFGTRRVLPVPFAAIAKAARG